MSREILYRGLRADDVEMIDRILIPVNSIIDAAKADAICKGFHSRSPEEIEAFFGGNPS